MKDFAFEPQAPAAKANPEEQQPSLAQRIILPLKNIQDKLSSIMRNSIVNFQRPGLRHSLTSIFNPSG
jgi:hypothetical protein